MKKLLIIIIFCVANVEAGRRFGLQTPLTDDTVGLWHFNRGPDVNTLYDVAGNNNGDIVGATWVDSPMGDALDFNTDRVQWNSNFGSVFESNPTWSIFFWVKTTDTGDTVFSAPSFWDYRESSYGADIMNIFLNENNQVQINYRQYGGSGPGGHGAYPLSGTSQINDGKWHFIGFTRGTDKETMKVYVDGILENERNDVSDYMSNVSMCSIAARRTYTGSWTSYLDSSFANLFIINSTLSRSEVKYLYNLQAPAFGKERIQ